MTGNSPSTGRPAQDEPRCFWCKKPLSSHAPYVGSLHACWIENLVALSATGLAAWEREIHPLVQVDAGSSSTTTGSTRSRGWSKTGSSGSVCRRLKRVRSVPIWTAVKSQRGTDTGRTSGSLKSWPEVESIIGQADRTHAECNCYKCRFLRERKQ
jgi:hypothetical protein